MHVEWQYEKLKIQRSFIYKKAESLCIIMFIEYILFAFLISSSLHFN